MCFSLAALATLCAVLLYRAASPSHALHFKSVSAQPIFFDLGSNVRIEMVECKSPGGNRFWIGASHVTNAEWLRVTGNKRDGVDDEPG